MRTVTRSTGHTRQVALNIGQTLTVSANPDRTALALGQVGTKTNLTVTIGDGDPVTLTSNSIEDIGQFIGGNGVVLTSKITITTDVNTTIYGVLSDPNSLSVA